MDVKLKSEISSVLFLIFNRPKTTEVVFEAIKKAKPSRLYIASDGARSEVNGETELVEKARAITELIDWPCQVHRLYREENIGCKAAVSSAITWFFTSESEGIILEDDCLPNSDFFEFCSQLLVKYRDDQRIGAICGTNLYNLNTFSGKENSQSSYYFSKGLSVWGWATWRRVWSEYDPEIKKWDKLRVNKAFKSNFEAGKWRLLIRSFNAVFSNKLNTWDFQFGFLLLSSSRFCITPQVNLVKNIGFDNNATHTKNKIAAEGFNETRKLDWPLIEPLGIYHTKYKDDYLDKVYSSKFRRLLTVIYRKLNFNSN